MRVGSIFMPATHRLQLEMAQVEAAKGEDRVPWNPGWMRLKRLKSDE